MEVQQIVLTDAALFDEEHLNIVTDALNQDDDCERIHFRLISHGHNLELKVPAYERYYKYNLQISIGVNELKQEFGDDIPAIAKGVCERLFDVYKTNLRLQ